MSRYTREGEHTSTSWSVKGWSPSTKKHETSKSSYSDDGEDSANDSEGVAVEGKEKTHGREKGTEEDGVTVLDTKENTSEQENVEDFVATEKKLWDLHRLLNNRKGNLSSTCKKNTKANIKVHHLKQKTMQVPGGVRDLGGNHDECDARDRGGRHAVRGCVRGHGGA